MVVTLVVGLLAFLLAVRFTTVLGAILQAYAFMVSGLFIPTLGAYFWKRGSSAGALAGMVGGGSLTLLLIAGVLHLPDGLQVLGLDPALYGILFSALLFVPVSLTLPDKEANQ